MIIGSILAMLLSMRLTVANIILPIQNRRDIQNQAKIKKDRNINGFVLGNLVSQGRISKRISFIYYSFHTSVDLIRATFAIKMAIRPVCGRCLVFGLFLSGPDVLEHIDFTPDGS